MGFCLDGSHQLEDLSFPRGGVMGGSPAPAHCCAKWPHVCVQFSLAGWSS